MKKTNAFPKALFSVPLVLALTACGGGGGGGGGDVNSSGGAPTGSTPNTQNPTQQQTEAVSGKVADGYIRGATVCLDVNRNKRCDSDEPSDITGPGGTYSFDATAEQQKAPIVAEVPATAIDEDTGEAVGKKVVFSAPPKRPGFVSPITTRMQEKLEQNPNLDIAGAEQSVKKELGIDSGEGDVSLFEDYVSGGKTERDEARSKRLKYLHKTARVITNLMGEIQSRVEEAATDSGLDVGGDEENFSAFQRMVSEELSKLLPEITAKVTEQIERELSEGTEETPAEFDPNTVVGTLSIPTIEQSGFEDRINGIKAKQAREAINAEQMLTEGIYEPSIECESTHHRPSDTSEESEESEQMAMPSMPNCQSAYSKIFLSDDKRQLLFERYVHQNGGWALLDESSEEDQEQGHHGMMLVNGEWVKQGDGDDQAPLDIVALNDEGALLLSDPDTGERIRVTGQSLDVANRPLRHIAPIEFPDGVDTPRALADLRFPDGSVMYQLDIETQSDEYYFYVQSQSYEQDPAGMNCENRGGNCNVIHLQGEDGTAVPQTTLQGILDVAQQSAGATVIHFAHDHRSQRDIVLTLKAADGAEEGDAQWFFQKTFSHQGEGGGSAPPSEGERAHMPPEMPEEPKRPEEPPVGGGAEEQPIPEPEMPLTAPPEGPNVGEQPEAPSEVPEHPEGQETDPSQQPAADDGEALRRVARSAWSIKEVDGVKLLVIELPRMIRLHHEEDADISPAIFFTEHTGFVRRGEWTPSGRLESVEAFNETAIEALKANLADLPSEGGEPES